METISREKIILERQFEIVKQRHSEFCVVCDDSKGKLNTIWLWELNEKLSKINSIADAHLKTPKEEEFGKKTNKSNLKMEKMPCQNLMVNHDFINDLKGTSMN